MAGGQIHIPHRKSINKAKVAAFVYLLANLVSHDTWAQQPNQQVFNEGRWFTAATVSIGAADLHESSHGGTIGTGAPLFGYLDGALENRRAVDTVAGLGLAVGWQHQQWHVETETLWRVRTDWDLRAPTPSIQTVTNIETNVSNITFLLNGSRTWGVQDKIQFQVGGGFGVGYNRYTSKYKERPEPGVSEAFESRAKSNNTQFVWNLSAGVQRRFSPRWYGRLRYRYLDLGMMEVGPYPDRPAVLRGRHSAHELQLTLVRFSRRW